MGVTDDRVPLDYVMTLRDLRRPGVDFSERVEIESGDRYMEVRALADVARLRLAAKAGELRSHTDNPNDPADVRVFAGKMLDVDDPLAPQSVASGLVGLTFVATYHRRADRG